MINFKYIYKIFIISLSLSFINNIRCMDPIIQEKEKRLKPLVDKLEVIKDPAAKALIVQALANQINNMEPDEISKMELFKDTKSFQKL